MIASKAAMNARKLMFFGKSKVGIARASITFPVLTHQSHHFFENSSMGFLVSLISSKQWSLDSVSVEYLWGTLLHEIFATSNTKNSRGKFLTFDVIKINVRVN